MKQTNKVQRSGRVLSAATEALIRQAIEHTQKSLDLLQGILDTNVSDKGARSTLRRIENSWTHAPAVH